MAASSKPSISPTSSKNRGRFSTGARKGHIIPSKATAPFGEEEDVFSHTPVRQMKQVRKSKSEKGKLKIYGSAQDLGPGKTRWHISLPNIHDTQQFNTKDNDNTGHSPSRSQGPLPPPPSNPPPVLNASSNSDKPKGREMVKSASAGAINIVHPSPGREFALQRSAATKPTVANVGEDKKREIMRERLRKGPPPKVPPPFSIKARAATVVSAAIQEHMQSSTKSAPGGIQKNDEGEKPLINVKGRTQSEHAVHVPDYIKETQKTNTFSAAQEDEKPELTASLGGGVKSLARYFSARSKEGLAKPAPLPKNSQSRMRAVRGRQLFRIAARKTTSIPETCNEESESPTGQVPVCRLPPIRSISNDPNEKYEVLHNVGSVVSSGSPTHMSIFSWYNVDADSKSELCNVSKKRYQNVFDDEAFAQFDKTGQAKGDKDLPVSPKSPFREYQNVLVETATLEETDVQSAREGSHKEKKPIPLPRTQSREKGMGLQNDRVRHLATSDSEGTLFVSTSQFSIDNRMSDYIAMASSSDSGSTRVQEVKSSPCSPGIVVMGALDPEWRANFEEMIQKEIEMTEGFSDSDESEVAGQEQEVLEKRMPSPPTIPAKKAPLKKTQSHNPNESIICRRNTPKEKKEMRKGVCSETDQIQDEYIAMKSTEYKSSGFNNTPLPSLTSSGTHSEITSSLSIQKPGPGIDPRSSTYYLKILPSPMVKPPEEALTAKNPVPIKHYYIEIDVPDTASEASSSREDISRGPTLPPKSSPVHHPASGKHKLKYPKISVGPVHRPEVVKGENVWKTPYSLVKVNDTLTEEPSAIDSSLNDAFERQRTQGSIFANEMMNYVDRPLPPPPLNDAIYYKTVNYPLGHIPAMRRVWHHEYIEIDEEELNKKNATPLPKAAEGWINIHAAGGPIRVGDTKPRAQTTLAPPPPVPKRPSCPYVEIDSEEMEEMIFSLPSEQIENNHGQFKDQLGANVGPRTARNNGAPPVVPSRSEESRQRSFSSSGEYSYPTIPGLKFQWMNFQRGEADQAYFTPRVPLPAVLEKKSLMEKITEKSKLSEHPPTLPPKTESLLREQKGYISRNVNRPSPYLVPVSSIKLDNLSETQYDHLSNRVPSPDVQRPKSPKEVVSNLRKELFREVEDDTSSKASKLTELPEHLKQKKKAMFPPYHPMPYAMSFDQKQKVNPPPPSPPPKLPKKQRKVSKDEDNSILLEKSNQFDQDLVNEGETNTVAQSPPDTLAVRKARLQHRIDRDSLAMIMRNKSAIAKQLEKENDSPKNQRKQMVASAESESTKDVSVVRSLGDILLDVDSLLQRRMCSEDDLIAAIEAQLNIKLVKKPSHSSDRERRRSNEGGSLEDSVQVTDQDVEEVVNFMNRKQLSPHQSPSAVTNESREDEGWSEASVIFKSEQQQESDSEPAAYKTTKKRSSTFIVNSLEDIEWKQENSVNEQHSPVHYGRNQLPSENSEEEIPESPENHLRDSRSSSVGLKPLRRVKARRKTNPASDMANLNSATNHFTQGTGVFTYRGGTLTNLTSEVEIEVPKGAVAPGKRQKLWFEVIHKMYNPEQENKGITLQVLPQNELSDSNSSVEEVDSFLHERRKRMIQLSTMVLIGPSDAKFEKPIKIKMPHCLPYRNNSWHLHLQARAQNCESDDWLELSNSSGLIIPQSKQRQRFFKDSTYQMHLHYAVVRTREMGCFKLCGTPMRNGSHSAKKMVASIFAKQDNDKSWFVLVTLSDAVHDQIQTLDSTQRKAGYTSLEHSVPVLCFGEGKDLELSLCAESNSLPLATQVIPFGRFWRLEKVGQARASFVVGLDQVESSRTKTLTLKIQQANSKLFHETNFVLAS